MLTPTNSFKCYGYANFKSGAGMNSLTLTNSGHRSVEFKDGTKIDFDYGKVRIVLTLGIIQQYTIRYYEARDLRRIQLYRSEK